MKKVGVDELEEVAGGKHKHHHKSEVSSIAECPPGTIEIKNEVLQNYHDPKKKCPECGSHDLETVEYYIVDTKILARGQKCPNGHRWLTA